MLSVPRLKKRGTERYAFSDEKRFAGRQLNFLF